MTSSAITTEPRTRQIVQDKKLHTVCEEAACPNLGHCWNQGTATFMIMGDICTRRCGFCNIKTARPKALEPDEPERLAQAIQGLNLRHAVITSVDRDELDDCGSTHFAECIKKTKELNPNTIVEVLIPDFKANENNLRHIWDAQPDIINHNLETVAPLFKTICPQSNYQKSLSVLERSAQKGFICKSGLILGLGESLDEVKQSINDLKNVGIQMLTIGQYLQPSAQHTKQTQFFEPEVFDDLKQYALSCGIQYVEAGPLVRSSYHAADSWEAMQAILK